MGVVIFNGKHLFGLWYSGGASAWVSRLPADYSDSYSRLNGDPGDSTMVPYQNVSRPGTKLHLGIWIRVFRHGETWLRKNSCILRRISRVWKNSIDRNITAWQCFRTKQRLKI